MQTSMHSGVWLLLLQLIICIAVESKKPELQVEGLYKYRIMTLCVLKDQSYKYKTRGTSKQKGQGNVDENCPEGGLGPILGRNRGVMTPNEAKSTFCCANPACTHRTEIDLVYLGRVTVFYTHIVKQQVQSTDKCTIVLSYRNSSWWPTTETEIIVKIKEYSLSFHTSVFFFFFFIIKNLSELYHKELIYTFVL